MVRSPTISYDGALLFVWLFVFVVVAVVVVVFFCITPLFPVLIPVCFGLFIVRFIFEVLYRSLLPLASSYVTANLKGLICHAILVSF